MGQGQEDDEISCKVKQHPAQSPNVWVTHLHAFMRPKISDTRIYGLIIDLRSCARGVALSLTVFLSGTLGFRDKKYAYV